MTSDQGTIKQIEKIIRKKLNPIPLYEPDESSNYPNGFTLDEEGRVIGLNLHRNELKDIKFLSGFTNLTHLSLFNNKIEDVSPLGSLVNLQKLLLSSNQIADVSPLGFLVNLQSLNLNSNQLSDVSPLGSLVNLQTLYLGENKLFDVSPLGSLVNLQRLDLDKNQIIDVSPLGSLVNLKKLYLSENKIDDVSPLGSLVNLQSLNLYSNQLSDVLPLKGLGKLERLYLEKNQVTHLPQDIGQWPARLEIKWDLESGRGMFLEDNPLVSPPPEIVKQGRQAVINYFKAMEGEKRALNEVKVLLVGDGGAGKTSLVKRLKGEGFSEGESQTQGIDIQELPAEIEGEQIRVRTWDFGGQEIMHATHQFFLSKRSLYILVLDSRKDAKEEYWLKHIQSFGGDSPVLIVINKIDENASFDVNRVFLQEKYPNIKGFFKVSCSGNKGIKEFNRAFNQELARVEMIHSLWPQNWFNLKERLERMKEHFISYERFTSMCREENILDSSAQNTLVEFLNCLGVILHFIDFKLKNIHVLEPLWVTKAVYKIINSNQLAETKGLLKLDKLAGILEKKEEDDFYYPQDKHPYIIELMNKFELCYEFGKDNILIPDLLAIDQPAFDFDYETALRFQIEYDFLPRSIMPRFIVRMHKDIDDRLRWRTGVVLKDEKWSSRAVVKADINARTIFIYVQGEQRRDYFAIILKQLREIHSSFKKLQAKELVPMPGEPHVTVSYQHLLKLEKRGSDSYFPDGSDKDYNVKDLLGSLHSHNKNEERIIALLEKIKEQNDTPESLGKKVNETLILQPNFFGIGLNFNNLMKYVNKIFKR